jgi:geranylgeranyl pyrophosphate synthase
MKDKDVETRPGRRPARGAVTPADQESAWELPRLLGLVDDIQRLHELIVEWVDQCDLEIKAMVQRQFSGRAKYFRPVTVFACYRAVARGALSDRVLRSAALVEMTHNMTLVVDDILDRTRYRRGQLSLHCRFGFLPALMAAGYIAFSGADLVASDPYSVRLQSELLRRLAVAECLQWRVRRHPMGVEDWRQIAGEDTGAMFEICARLGTRDDRLQRFGRLLGILYHGCDDVADVRGTTALGGGKKDILDGILTLPVAIATRDPYVAVLFRSEDPAAIPPLTERLVAALPEAEQALDGIAAEAEAEALAAAQHPDRLLDLVRHTRALSEI